jgi:hypothetical protein
VMFLRFAFEELSTLSAQSKRNFQVLFFEHQVLRPREKIVDLTNVACRFIGISIIFALDACRSS